MSLKAIEMQIALPRTHEAGKLQEQMQMRGQLQHLLAEHEVHKDEEKKKSTVIKQEQKAKLSFDSQQGQGDRPSSHSKQNKKKQSSAGEQQINHPYKGNRIDFSG
jgi:hypothetical protein